MSNLPEKIDLTKPTSGEGLAKAAFPAALQIVKETLAPIRGCKVSGSVTGPYVEISAQLERGGVCFSLDGFVCPKTGQLDGRDLVDAVMTQLLACEPNLRRLYVQQKDAQLRLVG